MLLAGGATGRYPAAMRRRFFLFVVLLLLAAGAAGWHWREPVVDWLAERFPRLMPESVQEPVPDPARYSRLRAELDAKRRYLATQYATAKSHGPRAAIEQQARHILEETLPEMMRCWLGTPWDFNGTARKPGAGQIACGYFVATVLVDAGFNVDHFKLARQASGNIMRSFLPDPACNRMIGRPYEEFTAAIEALEPGVYFIGLDRHVGFIVREADGGFRFIHSSGGAPKKVVEECPAEAAVLQASRWREFGSLTGTPAAIRAWLTGHRVAVKGNS